MKTDTLGKIRGILISVHNIGTIDEVSKSLIKRCIDSLGGVELPCNSADISGVIKSALHFGKERQRYIVSTPAIIHPSFLNNEVDMFIKLKEGKSVNRS